MDSKQQPIEEQLLIRYCAGQATEQECKVIEAWLAQSAEHEQLLRQLLSLSWHADLLRVLPLVDTEKAWQRVNRKLGGKAVSLSRRLWMKFQLVAAILILPLIMTFSVLYYYVGQPTEKESDHVVEVRTNPGMTTQFELPDGSKVHLNSESVLRYPATFDKTERRVELKGEAYFEVEKEHERPFVVTTPHKTQVEVLGTTFNLEAFESEPNVQATLLSGKIRFAYTQGAAMHALELRPGHKLIYDVAASEAHVFTTNGLSEAAWKDGKIIFDATPLPEALRMLEKRFHVRLILRNTRFRDEAFTGTFTTQRLERILEVFRFSSGIRWRYIDNPNKADEKTTIELY
ncbi:MAG: FecR family protein [Parabacteroides sp.]